MRLIGSLGNQQQAETFTAFMLTEGIAAHVEEENGKFDVWIKDEDYISQAVAELELFRIDPESAKYLGSVAKARQLQEEEIRKRRLMAKNVVSVSGGQVPKNRSLTICLIVVSGVVAVLTGFGANSNLIKAPSRALVFTSVPREVGEAEVLKNGNNYDAIGVRTISIWRGEIWRLVTPIFLHADVLHLLFNMYILFLLGSQIENRYGPVWFGLLILLGAAIPNFVQCVVPYSIGGTPPFFEGNYFIHGLRGMSGVNYALLGFIMMKMSYDRSSGLFIPQSMVLFLLGWLVFCMTPMATWMGLNVANWAHAIGLFVGVAAGYWPVLFGTADK